MTEGDSFGHIVLDHQRAWATHGFTGTASDLVAQQSLVHAWIARWGAHPDQPILLGVGDATNQNTGWLTARDLDRQSKQVALRLIAFGLKAADRIAMSCLPCVDLIVLHIAAMRAGLTVVPINTAFTDKEVKNILAEAHAKLFVSDRVDSAEFDGVPSTDLRLELLPQETPQAHQQIEHRNTLLRTDYPAMLLFTSGTTGRPKGAVLSHGNLLASAQALVTAWSWTPTDRLVLSLPLFHMHGLGVGVHGTLLAGASAVVLPSFSVEGVFDAIAQHDATLMFGVPTMWVRILASTRVAELGKLRLCVSGSAPLAATVWNGLAERGGQHIIERYGMTETVMLTSNPYEGNRCPGAVGLPLPGVEVRLTQYSTEGTKDGIGEIEVRGPNVFGGYLASGQPNASNGLVDGWFATGDLGRVDHDGYLSIVGRSKDLVISGGYNVYPNDVEEVIRTHMVVFDCAVVGEPSDEWGETVVAFVIAKPGRTIDVDELSAFCRSNLANYQTPKRIVVVDDFPRNALGKVMKADLRLINASREELR